MASHIAFHPSLSVCTCEKPHPDFSDVLEMIDGLVEGGGEIIMTLDF